MTNKSKTKKILFYVHFNKYNRVDEYVIYQLQQMKQVFDKVILISNSKVSDTDKDKFTGLYDEFIQRENKGFDFAAWRDAMHTFGWDALAKYDELTIMNDTCFGPIYDFQPIYEKMQSKKIDFWGMTVNVALKGLVVDGDGKFVLAPAHIQSYYMTFNKNVVTSTVFREFWENVKNHTNVQDVIIDYEIRLTDLLESAGFTYDAYYNAKNHWKKKVMTRNDVDISAISAGDMSKYNPGYTCTRPLWLLTSVDNYPFIKTKAVSMAASQMNDIKHFIEEKTNYPSQLIDIYIGSRHWDLSKLKDDQINDIMNSRSYKLGNRIAAPWRMIKGIKK